jgi:hypothetical protein
MSRSVNKIHRHAIFRASWYSRSVVEIERPPINIPTLAEAGIDKDLSSRAQKLAAVP